MVNMGARPGTRNGGGRAKGTPNKDTKTLRELISQACGEDWNPVVEMAKAARTGLWPVFDPLTGQQQRDELGLPVMAPVGDKIRARFAEESSQYLYPKRKAVELTDGDGNPLLQKIELVFEDSDD